MTAAPVAEAPATDRIAAELPRLAEAVRKVAGAERFYVAKARSALDELRAATEEFDDADAIADILPALDDAEAAVETLEEHRDDASGVTAEERSDARDEARESLETLAEAIDSAICEMEAGAANEQSHPEAVEKAGHHPEAGSALEHLEDQGVTEVAKARANRIRAGFVSVLSLTADVAAAWQGREWIALGLPSWGAYCDEYMYGYRPKLDVLERRESVAALTELGMSGRAIGDALGVSRETVRRDQAADTDVSPDGEVRPTKVTGTDGKIYPTPSSTGKRHKGDPDESGVFNVTSLGAEPSKDTAARPARPTPPARTKKAPAPLPRPRADITLMELTGNLAAHAGTVVTKWIPVLAEATPETIRISRDQVSVAFALAMEALDRAAGQSAP